VTARSELFFEFGDRAGQAHFLSWHQLRHRTYDLIASTRGVSLPMQDFTGKVDDDWLLRHGTRHTTLRKLAGAATGSNLPGLKTIHWEDKTERGIWLLQHALEHQALDKYFGL
jgi:hypothetical protein